MTLTPSLDLEVFDDSGKKLKNLPAPGKKDDEEKAAEAYAAFKEMKKQMKAAVSSQKARLEYALSAQRVACRGLEKSVCQKSAHASVCNRFDLGGL